MKKILLLILSLTLVLALFACAGDGGEGTSAATDTSPSTETSEPEELDDPLKLDNVVSVSVDTSKTHQTIESFGASGAWWAQIIGTNEKTRDRIATLLFDPEEGIGLNCYRYNIGGGSRDAGSNSPSIGDVWRRTYSFEKSPGVYDWERDAGAVWMMRRAAELGADEIVMFVNSPLERLTVNGRTYADNERSNLAPQNYEAFAKYVLDVAEHFKDEGLPIKFISPINEPQYYWNYPPENVWGQEGCHYSNDEIVKILTKFIEEIGERPGLDGVEISGPEGGSWNPDTLEFNRLIAKDKFLSEHMTALDNHSYWTDTKTKTSFKTVMDKIAPNMKYRQSEWCEMTNGRDLTMDSALVLAETVYEDMTILDCVSWQYWIAVSCYDYRDGLIYTDASGNSVQVPKRLWALGNYSRYIDRGYVRVDCGSVKSGVSASAYTGKNENGEDEVVIVLVNHSKSDVNISVDGLANGYNRISTVVTSKSYGLRETYRAEYKGADTPVVVPAESVTTVIVSSKG